MAYRPRPSVCVPNQQKNQLGCPLSRLWMGSNGPRPRKQPACEDKRRMKRVGEGIWAFAAAASLSLARSLASPRFRFSPVAGTALASACARSSVPVLPHAPPTSPLLRLRGSSSPRQPVSPTRCALFFSAPSSIARSPPSQSKKRH